KKYTSKKERRTMAATEKQVLTNNDKLQQVDQLVKNGQAALEKFLNFDQEQINAIIKEMALAGLNEHMRLAKMAVEETKRGVYEDKIIKNLFATEYIYHNIKYDKTVGIIDDNAEEGLVKIADPVG